MIQFRKELKARLLQLIPTWVGSDVRTFDDYLHDVERNQLPYITVHVRTAEKAAASEIGTDYDLRMWTIHIYYLDIHKEHELGDELRDKVLGTITKKLEENRRLDNLEVIDPDSHREYVYDSSISAVLFDESGQEEEYTFVSELYLNVYTACT